MESILEENKLIGISWAVMDYDGDGKRHSFWNLLELAHNVWECVSASWI